MRGILIPIALSLGAAALAGTQNVSTRTLAKPQAEYPEPFTELGSIRELRDGRVVVVDSRELTVKLVDFRSGHATTIGRTGEGPGEYRWPTRLFALPGDSTLLEDAAGGRLLIIEPDGKPGGFFDPNRPESDSVKARTGRFFVRASDARGFLYSEAQPIRMGSGGLPELADHSAIERHDFRSGKRDTVALWPVRKDANARVIDGMVMTRPRLQAFPAWDHWVVSHDGRVAFVHPEPYRVDFVAANRSVVENPPIAYDRVRVDDALKKQFKEERERPRMALVYGRGGGGSSMQMMPGRYTEPAEWPDYLPPYLSTSVFGPDGMLWIPRATSAGRPPLYDIVDGRGRLSERVQLAPRTRLVGFGANSVYIVRLDDDDLQYLQRYALPTTGRP